MGWPLVSGSATAARLNAGHDLPSDGWPRLRTAPYAALCQHLTADALYLRQRLPLRLLYLYNFPYPYPVLFAALRRLPR